MLFHVLAHVEIDHRFWIAEHKFCDRFRQQSLTDSRWTDEQERSHRTLRVLQSSTSLADRTRNSLDRFVLADDFAMQLGFELQQSLRFALCHTSQRNARHLCDNFANDFFVHNCFGFVHAVAPSLLDFFLLFAQFFRLIAQFCSLLIVRTFDSFVLLDCKSFDFFFEFGQVRWLGHAFQSQSCACFVDHIDRLIWLHTTRDVTSRQFHRTAQSIVGVFHTMMRRVSISKSLENFNRLHRIWWFDCDGLESSFERSIFFDVLAVFIEGSCADALDFTARESRLENIGRIDCAFCSTSSNERVQFINKEDDILGASNFVHDGLDAFFKLSTVFRSCNHCCKIEHNKSLVIKQIRNFLIDDRLCKTFGNCSLSNACFTQKNWIVLCAAAENLNKPFDFSMTTDDGIKLVIARQFRQVAAE